MASSSSSGRRLLGLAFAIVLLITLGVVGLNFTALVLTTDTGWHAVGAYHGRPDHVRAGLPFDEKIDLYRPPAHNPLPGSFLGERTVSCPLYSGPGYNKERHPSKEISVPAFAAPFDTTPQTPVFKLEPLSPSDVRLTVGSAFERAFNTNHQYLLSVDTDALLLSWRLNSPGG